MFQFLKKFEDDVIQREYPALSRDRADRTIEEPLGLADLNAVIKVLCGSSWRPSADKQLVNLVIAGQLLGTGLGYCPL